jgi:hydrogenase maturation protein HypF
LAVGAHLKNSIALAVGPQVFISQHIGDLETVQAFDALRRVVADFQHLYDSPASLIVADAHPDYLSTKFAQASGLPCTQVQHHVAHVLSCMAENDLEPPVLGVSWDGTGYGLDGTVWGGEFFRIRTDGYDRVAHFRQFGLPGGEQAVREPRRSALGLLFEAFGAAALEWSDLATLRAFSSSELVSLNAMLRRALNSPLTSSVGRLFDAVASLMGLRQRTRFEGQAAMEIEFLAADTQEAAAYELAVDPARAPVILDWRPTIEAILTDLKEGVPLPTISVQFHNMLIESIVKVAQRTGLEAVGLSGGCFQNRYLTEHAVRRLTQEGFRTYWQQRLPPNDGGICLGQVVAARWWKV